MGQLLQRARLNLVIAGTLKQQQGIVKTLAHKEIRFNNLTWHRVYAQGRDDRVAGVGVALDPYQAQLTALMECVERHHYYAKPVKPTTNGLSCHFNRNEARQAALIELAERDQALLSVFYNKVLWEIDHNQDKNVRLFYLTHDLPIHVVMTEIASAEKQRCYGFGAAFDLARAKDKALKEALLLYDSRNVPPPTDIRGNLWHILPFVVPTVCSTEIPPFSPADYDIKKLDESSLPNHSLRELENSLRKSRIHVEFVFTKQKLLPFFSVVVCQAFSNGLQELFFSENEIQINKKRAQGLGYACQPRHAALHPIS